MTVRPVRLWPDPVLTGVAAPVGDVTPEVRALARDMFDTMYAAPGRGLAAPQVGVPLRLFVMEAGWKAGAPTPLVFIDPVIAEAAPARATGPEGCLSLPGIMADVERAARVRVVWTDAEGQPQDRWFDGFEAVCIQHEADHLDGILTLDRIDPAEATRLRPLIGT